MRKERTIKICDIYTCMVSSNLISHKTYIMEYTYSFWTWYLDSISSTLEFLGISVAKEFRNSSVTFSSCLILWSAVVNTHFLNSKYNASAPLSGISSFFFSVFAHSWAVFSRQTKNCSLLFFLILNTCLFFHPN